MRKKDIDNIIEILDDMTEGRLGDNFLKRYRARLMGLYSNSYRTKYYKENREVILQKKKVYNEQHREENYRRVREWREKQRRNKRNIL